MSTKVGWCVALTLFVVFVTMSFYLNHMASRSRQVPVFMPLIVDGGAAPQGGPDSPPPPIPGEDAPKAAGKRQDLELAGVETMMILQKAGRLGPTVSIEDFVRGLLWLSKEGGEHELTKAQKEKLLPVIKDAYNKRLQLLTIYDEILKLENDLPAQAIQAAEKLSDLQIETIKNARDKISLLGFENDYWLELIAYLESA